MPPRHWMPAPRGRVRPYVAPAADRATWTPIGDWGRNTILYEWGAIVGGWMATGNPAYRVGGMYVEFANAAPPISAPSYTRADGRAYYAGLAGDPVRDFLRVPLIAAPLSSSDLLVYPGGNVNTFYARTAGAVGVGGLPFSSGAGSTVYGAALVALVDPDDPASDLVLARHYFASGAQLVKPPGLQLAIDWEITWQ